MSIRLFGLQILAAPQVSYRNSSQIELANGPRFATMLCAARSVVWRACIRSRGVEGSKDNP